LKETTTLIRMRLGKTIARWTYCTCAAEWPRKL